MFVLKRSCISIIVIAKKENKKFMNKFKVIDKENINLITIPN